MKTGLAEQEEHHEVGGEEGADDLEHPARVHGANEDAVRGDDQHQQDRLQAHGVAAQLRTPLGEDERLADRADQVVGHHQCGSLQEEHRDASTLARMHFRGQAEKSLEPAQLPPGVHWGKASPRAPVDLSSA